jgi:TrmH family RNA methyltransferase
VTLVLDALACGVDIDEVIVEPALDPAALATIGASGVPVRHAPEGALARALSTVTPQPVAAVARMPRARATDLAATGGPLLLVLVGVGDPGNAGTLLRTAEAAGARAVLFCDGSVDPHNPKCVRASAGSLFRVPVATGEAVEVLEACEEAGLARVATIARGGTPLDRADLLDPFALVLGSEAHGLPATLDELLDVRVTIPMEGRVESLNVAMAGAVVCFEALRQRRVAG